MRRTYVAIAVVSLVLGGFLLCQEPASGQKTKGKTRPAPTKVLMKCIMAPNCGALGKLLKDGPADDAGWDTAVLHATVLNEMSYIVMDDGRCPDAKWAGAAKKLRECSAKVLAAAEGKDAEAARGAFKNLTTACAACHKAHKG